MTAILINKAHFPVTVLGPGRRIGIWMQGCRIGCKGCISMDTWQADSQRATTVAQLLAWCREVTTEGFDGVTISGGEPFDQPQALKKLLLALHGWRKRANLVFDILVYSGYPLKTLQKRYPALLLLLDALIPEPFIEGQSQTHLWRGSANQPLITLSELGRQCYADYLTSPAQAKQIQVAVTQDKIWFIGIPGRRDMAALEILCESRGLSLQQVSWR